MVNEQTESNEFRITIVTPFYIMRTWIAVAFLCVVASTAEEVHPCTAAFPRSATRWPTLRSPIKPSTRTALVRRKVFTSKDYVKNLE